MSRGPWPLAAGRWRPHAARARSRPAGRRHGAHGQALVELALITPVLLLLLLVAVDFGRLFFTYIQLNNAAREGAAYGAASPTDTSGIGAAVRREANVQAQGGENTALLTVAVACQDPSAAVIACGSAIGGAGIGNQVVVTVNEPFTFLTPVIGNVVGGNLPMSVTSTAAVDNPAPCTVPNFVGLNANQASGTWTGAGFAAGNLTNNVGSGTKIDSQTLAAGTTASCSAARITLN